MTSSHGRTYAGARELADFGPRVDLACLLIVRGGRELPTTMMCRQEVEVGPKGDRRDGRGADERTEVVIVPKSTGVTENLARSTWPPILTGDQIRLILDTAEPVQEIASAHQKVPALRVLRCKSFFETRPEAYLFRVRGEATFGRYVNVSVSGECVQRRDHWRQARNLEAMG